MAVQVSTDLTTKNWTYGARESIDSATIVQAIEATAGTLSSTNSWPLADQDTDTIVFSIDSGAPQTVTFATTTTSNAHVATACDAQLTGASAAVVGSNVVVTSDSTGAASRVDYLSGTSIATWGTPVVGTDGVGLADKTVMSQNPSTRVWQALTNVSATDGTELPTGIYEGDAITSATFEAGSVTGRSITVKLTFDEDQLVLQNSLTLDSVIGSITKNMRMAMIGNDLVPKKSQALNPARTV